MSHDASELESRYRTWSTERLIEVIHPKSDFLPHAVAAAEAELRERGVDLEGMEAQLVLAEVEDQHAAKRERASAPLGVGLRIFCAVLPGLAALIIAGYHFASGRPQAGSDALKWTMIGIVGYVVLGLLLS